MSEHTMNNPIGLAGIEFVELVSRDPEALHRLLLDFGFSRTMRHQRAEIDLYEQGDIRFLLNRSSGGQAAHFGAAHGPSICSMGWRTRLTPEHAAERAVERGAQAAEGDYVLGERALPAIYGIGESLIYLTPAKGDRLYQQLGFEALNHPDRVASKGFLAIDHLTNNVYPGTMQRWADFYRQVFGFTEVRYFDIRGEHTGLTSYALRSPDGSFCIPINEASEEKSQINEFLDEYHGPGVQHLAFLTEDLLGSLQALDGQRSVSFLDIDPGYYNDVFSRVPNVREDQDELIERDVLIDGDDRGYLLQIFTRNVIGPIFIELIQRNNHSSFGEGNFGALFRSIERDQLKRGYLEHSAR